MTNEQAIVYLESLKEYVDKIAYAPDMYGAIDKAIKALEQQPCEDCISRQEAIKVVNKTDYRGLTTEEVTKVTDLCAEALLALPSVQPQRKHGKWIKIGKDSRGYTDTFECSECGELIRFMFYMDDCEYDYCPYCLADMRGEEE